jgi:exopolyphosphatase/guanosine-5'-triphosphate,3'-diphosphate pyrophosphatase
MPTTPMTTSRICERRAVIDVGTKSVKLLMADVGRTVKPVLKVSRQTRLGQGSFRTKRLHPEAVARTAAAVAELGAQAAKLHPASIRVQLFRSVREPTRTS